MVKMKVANENEQEERKKLERMKLVVEKGWKDNKVDVYLEKSSWL